MKDFIWEIDSADADLLTTISDYKTREGVIKRLLPEFVTCGYGYYGYLGLIKNPDGRAFIKVRIGETLD